jgi:hypothetical protein
MLRGVLAGCSPRSVLAIEEWGLAPATRLGRRNCSNGRRWRASKPTSAARRHAPALLCLFIVAGTVKCSFRSKLLALWFNPPGGTALGITGHSSRPKRLGTAAVGRPFIITEPQLIWQLRLVSHVR